jgi:hypothetical protein
MSCRVELVMPLGQIFLAVDVLLVPPAAPVPAHHLILLSPAPTIKHLLSLRLPAHMAEAGISGHSTRGTDVGVA